jgi:hypothetical protein
VALAPGRRERSARFTETQARYLRASIDVTMKGGIASGVIYPLAICELARTFRLRNIGGASAGAIAAGFAAAAELGRARADRQALTRPGHPIPEDPKRSYHGLANTVAWLTQLDDEDEVKEEFRLAQLFKPLQATLPLFRLLVALMRKRYWALPVLLVTSFGRKMMVASIAFFVLMPVLLYVLATQTAQVPAPNPICRCSPARVGWRLGAQRWSES